ncbi:unnamed protein product [Polarella glacialis]|uniref:Major facilitator superfamily (MFS) profile domain-containing protein n=1 Tax=Polarella glacialis TaxID=89957 RepID=A0A813DNC5_POLGL|nr:unnamed protein product [Polarella glacialis]
MGLGEDPRRAPQRSAQRIPPGDAAAETSGTTTIEVAAPAPDLPAATPGPTIEVVGKRSEVRWEAGNLAAEAPCIRIKYCTCSMDEADMKKHELALASCYLAVFLDLVGAFMVAPFLPFVALSMQATTFQITFMQALYSLSQIVGTLVLGFLSDRVGRRKVLLVCLAASTGSLVAFGVARSFWQLLLFRALSGFFAGTIGICEAFIADIVEESQRAASLSKIGAVFGLGLMAGPGIGGAMAGWGFSFETVCFVAAGFTLANFAIGVVGLPEDKLAAARQSTAGQSEHAEKEAPGLLACMRQEPRIGIMFVHSFLTLTAVGIYIPIYPLYLHDRYGFGAADIGNIMFVAGIGAVVFQLGIPHLVVQAIGEKQCMALGSMLRACGYASLVAIPAPWIPYFSQICLVCFGGLIMPCQVSLTSAFAPEAARGSVLGVLNALGSFGQFVGPLIAGLLYKGSPELPFWLAAGISVLAALLASVMLRVEKDPAQSVAAELENGYVAPVALPAAALQRGGLDEPLLRARSPSRSPTKLELIHVDFTALPSVLMDSEACSGDTWASSRSPTKLQWNRAASDHTLTPADRPNSTDL